MTTYQIIFFDLENVLFKLKGGNWKYNSSIENYLLSNQSIRKGVLGTLPSGLTSAEVKYMLKLHGVEALLDSELLFFGTLFNHQFPDQRLFEAAAALAATPCGNIAYVTTKSDWRQIAISVGYQLIDIDEIEPASSTALFAETSPSEPPRKRTGLILKGRIVTMNQNKIIEEGKVIVYDDEIAAILENDDEVPEQFEILDTVETEATLYPGMIDLHNHYPYNILRLWNVPQKYNNRGTWFRNEVYRNEISHPVKLFARHTPTAKAIARYVEAKALVGGTCTGQGIARNRGGGVSMYRGAMRNVEASEDNRLPETNALVLDLKVNDYREIEKFRRNLQRYSAFFYHLSEGTDEGSRKRFLELADNNLLHPALVGIHGLALQKEDIYALAKANSKIVWSPFSNLLLYGETLRVEDLLEAGVSFALGCDWSPSGGKNLFFELKVARFIADQQKVAFTDESLVSLVTSEAAKLLGWETHLGKLQSGMFADVLAIKGKDGDPYGQLINATEKDIQLVMIQGVARYGDFEIMRKIYGRNRKLEKWQVEDKEKAFYLNAFESPLNDLSLMEAKKILLHATADLPAFAEQIRNDRLNLLSIDQEEFHLVLDMEHDDIDFDPAAEPTLLADKELPRSIPLDSLNVTAEDLDLIDHQKNLPEGLASYIRNLYSFKT